MDEEQPKKKITLNNFFEQIVEIDKVANAALTNSNMVQSQLNAVQLDLKRLVESLQVNFDSGVQNVQTQINEVTNVIVQEQAIKQSETNALEEEIFAQEDRLQKQVKGKKATPSDGNLIQKAISSVENKAKSNLLAAGLFGSSFLLAGFKGLKPPEKDYEKNRRRNRSKNKDDQDGDKNLDLYTEDKSQGSQGDDTAVEGGYTISRENLTTSQNIKLDNLQYGNTFPAGSFSTEIIKNIIDEKPVIENDKKISSTNITNNNIKNEEIKEFNLEKKELKNLLKYDPKSVIAAAIKSYNEGGTGIAGFNEKTGKIEVTSKEELQAQKEAVLSTKAGVQPDGGYSTYAANTVYSEFMGFDDGPVSNNVIDGGTTIIEGNNEVVNEDISSGQGRGEVATDVSILKSSNSPVSAVAIAEGNSLNHLTI